MSITTTTTLHLDPLDVASTAGFHRGISHRKSKSRYSFLTTFQEVRRRASDSVMAAIALHLELISALVAGAIQRHVPDAADVEAATAALAAMSVGAPPAAGPRRCSADQLD